MISTGFRASYYTPFATGGSLHIEANWMVRGEEASLFPVFTLSETVGVGTPGLGFDRTFTKHRFNGSINDLTRGLFEVQGLATEEGGVSVPVYYYLTVGGGYSFTPTNDGYSISATEFNVGLGTGPSIDVGNTSTQILMDTKDLVNDK